MAETPRRSAGPPKSPQVHPDRTVTFRIYAPDSDHISVWGEWDGADAPMEPDYAGVWSAMIGPLDPGLYGYHFNVDGLAMLDPGNSWVKPARAPNTSILDVPGAQPLIHGFQDVPHGDLRIIGYHSRSLRRSRRMRVYTPPGYEGGSDRYPVLCLLHGRGDNDATWSELGRAHLIADNLIASGDAVPLVIVMTDGHAYNEEAWDGDARRLNIEALRKDLLEDVLPLVDSRYRTLTDQPNRAIAGLSMGGGQAVTIGLNHLDLFSHVAGFSSYMGPPREAVAAALDSPDDVNRALTLLWLAIGEEDFLLDDAKEFHAALEAAGIEHQYQLTPGDHSWPVWRHYLAELLPVLFKEDS
jgi:enterochelin esterase family protein